MYTCKSYVQQSEGDCLLATVAIVYWEVAFLGLFFRLLYRNIGRYHLLKLNYIGKTELCKYDLPIGYKIIYFLDLLNIS